MKAFSIRSSLATLALGLGTMSAHAEITTNLSTWQADLGVSVLSSLPTIDFSFNSSPNATPTNQWWAPPPPTNIFAAYNPGVLSFNQKNLAEAKDSTYTQLFFTSGTSNSPKTYGAYGSVSINANPWGLQIAGGSNQYLDFYGSAPAGQSSAMGMQFDSACTRPTGVDVSACDGGFMKGVKAVSFDLMYKSGNFKTQADSLSSGQTAEEGLLMVKYLNLQTNEERFEYKEILNTGRTESPTYNIGAIANLNEVVFQLTYFSCYTHNKPTDILKEWAGCSAQAAVDNIRVVQAVPEPETYALLLGGLGLLALRSRSRRTVAVAA